MIRNSLTVLIILAAASLQACNTTNPAYQEKLNKDEYLKKSYPAGESVEKQKSTKKSDYYK